MKIIVDTNIVFSSILNSSGKIGELLIKSKNHFDFYSVDQLHTELIEHKEKIKQIGNFTDDEYNEVKELATSKIRFIRDTLIPKNDLIKAEQLLADIDPDDTAFLALAFNLNGKLWTGDMAMIKGLEEKLIHQTIATSDLFEIYLRKELERDF